jgi:hypothetical protein
VTLTNTLAQELSHAHSGYRGAVNPRRLGTLGLLAVLGVAGGFGLGAVMAGQDPDTFDEATPVPASPSYPAPTEPTDEPTAPYAPDISWPRLVPPTSFTRYRISNDLQTWSYLAPEGWTAYDVYDVELPPADIPAAGEIRFRPAKEPVLGGYSLRVKEVNDHLTTADMVANKARALGGYLDLVILKQTDDSLYITYRTTDSNRLRYNFFRWFAAPGSTEATLEMSVVGRKADEAGLRGFFDQFKSGLRPVD